MVFSSLSFLFLFLPFTLLIYYLLPKKFENFWLLFTSLLFYSFCGMKYTFLFIIEIIWNWFFGYIIFIVKNKLLKKLLMFVCIFFDVFILVFFKFNRLLSLFLKNYIVLLLPVGISFYTFQEISYVVDVYRGEKCQKNPFYLGLYLSFFPQLIAGPIVRYKDINSQLDFREKIFSNIINGVYIFCIGLSKKVLIANQLGSFVDIFYRENYFLNFGFPVLWLVAVSFALQIYYDFSGYSDMAVGLGRMFGFTIPQNFNYPYFCRSFTDFWHRWHISLSMWFKDYVYVPLGGNRRGLFRTFFNLMFVWGLTGMWHGYGLHYLFWGISWGVLLIIEKYIIKSNLIKNSLFYRIFVILVIILLWVIFRSDNLSLGFSFIVRLFSFKKGNFSSQSIHIFNNWFHDIWIYLLFGCFFSFPILSIIEKTKNRVIYDCLKFMYYMMVIIFTLLSISYIINGSYNPFLYYQF